MVQLKKVIIKFLSNNRWRNPVTVNICILLLVGVVAGCKTINTKPSLATEKLLFDQGWVFHLGAIDSLQVLTDTMALLSKSDTSWRKVTLPHDWSIEGAFSKANPAGNQGGALPGGIGWYRKAFTLLTADSLRKIYIGFDGVYRYSKVWINGHLLGERPNGFVSFTYSLRPYLHYDGRKNVLVVRVDNSAQPNSRWYSGSGINRDVWLIKKGPLSINDRESYFYTKVDSKDHRTADNDHGITGSSLQSSAATLHQHIVMEGEISSLKPVTVTSWIYDVDHQLVVRQKQNLQPLKTSGVYTLDGAISWKDARLWSAKAPYLYTLKVEITQDGQLLDRYTQRLGVRSFYFDPQKGFYLNGVATMLKGVCLHSDYGVLGSAYQYSAMVRQLKLLKDMGCNAIRTAHNPPPPGMLDLCDSMGFLVMDEAFDMWQKKKTKYDYSRDFARWHKRDLEDQIKRDRHHPSVILWSIGNEIREQFDTSGIRLTKELVAIVKSLDTTRDVICAMTEPHAAKNNIAKADALDVLGFNYKIDQYDSLPVNFPDKAFVASETVSALASRGVYKNTPEDSIIFMPSGPQQKYAPNINGDWTISAYDKVAAYWGTTHENAWRAVKDRPFIAGTFVWTGIDYLGEPVPYPFPARSSYYGIIDQAGLVKDIYYFYQSEWADKAVLHLLPHWNWKAGQVVDVWCYYSQADKVALFLNGKSLGERSKGDKISGDNEFHVSWQVPFAPGVLTAVSYKAGKIVRTDQVETAGAPRQIQVSVDTSTYRGIQGDLCYLTIQLTDKAGVPVPDQDQTLHFNLSRDSNAQLVGVNNGYQAELRSFRSNEYPTWKGKCVAVIRPGARNSSFTLQITGDGLVDKTVVVNLGK